MYVFDNDYTVSELCKLAYSLVTTKLLYPTATIVRRPFFIRGRNRISFGPRFACGYGCRLETFGDHSDRNVKLRFGENCHIGDYVHIAAREHVSLGDNCLLASHVFITDLNHGSYQSKPGESDPNSDPNRRPLFGAPVSIGDNVWIGENACILSGVCIGNGCVIGAGSVVTKDLPDNVIAVGSPARPIKQYDDTAGWVPISTR